MNDAELLYERRGPAAVITFNRPQARNAMTFAMYEALVERCDEADADDDVRVLVLRGAGGKAFVSGPDIRQFLDFDSGETGIDYERDIDRYVGRLERVRKPTVAVVDGYATGSGLALSSACDLRVCTPDAKFGMPIARTLGNCLSMRAYSRYLDLLGPSRLKEMIFTARLMHADEALAAGFVHEIVAAEAIAARVRELAETIASHAPITLWVTKEAIRRLQDSRPLPSGEDLVATTYGSADFREGVQAFLAKRTPRWTGK